MLQILVCNWWNKSLYFAAFNETGFICNLKQQNKTIVIMKKLLILLATMGFLISFGCNKAKEEAPKEEAPKEEAPKEETKKEEAPKE